MLGEPSITGGRIFSIFLPWEHRATGVESEFLEMGHQPERQMFSCSVWMPIFDSLTRMTALVTGWAPDLLRTGTFKDMLGGS
jgi:hypothetical protein